MLFHSLQFCVFLPVVVILGWSLRRSSALRLLTLLAASYFFYMSWNYRYAVLLLCSTMLDFIVGLELGKRQSPAVRRFLLVTSLTGNLGILFFFKYFNFFTESARSCVGLFGLPFPDWGHSFLLPVGISFYTFQSLSYTIDVYRGRLAPTRSFLKFALFVSFFPQLVAGPIVRASHFLPQLERTPAFDDKQFQGGVYLILVGLFKKICIADVLAVTLLDRVTNDPTSCSALELWMTAYGYRFQIYCDFSGYADIAIGAAAMLGYHLPINFNRPYLAISMGDYWRRWHISLSTWLRDYIYFPLGGSRISRSRTYVNLFIVVLLGGLWHGAAWNFVIWGGLHATALAVERLLGINKVDPQRMGLAERWIRRLITFHVLVVISLFFRFADVSMVGVFLQRMVLLTPGEAAIPGLFFLAMAIAVITHFSPTRLPDLGLQRFVAQPSYRQAVILVGCLVLFTTVSLPEAPFIYFQF